MHLLVDRLACRCIKFLVPSPSGPDLDHTPEAWPLQRPHEIVLGANLRVSQHGSQQQIPYETQQLTRGVRRKLHLSSWQRLSQQSGCEERPFRISWNP